MSTRNSLAFLMTIAFTAMSPLVRADESSEALVLKPPVAISDLPEDERLAAIIEQIEANEALYRNLEVRIRTQYDIGDRKPMAPGGDPSREVVRKDYITVFVSQNRMFRLETQGGMFLPDGPCSWRNIVQLFDGETTRLVQRKGSDPEENVSLEYEAVRPHTLLKRYAHITGSLSENLRDNRPKWLRGMEQTVSYHGAGEFQGLKCQIVRVAVATPGAGQQPPSSISELWLAESRNFLPIRLRLFAPERSLEVPKVEGEVDRLHEPKKGIWFPGRAVVTSFNPLDLSATGKQKLQWREQYSLTNVSLDPDHDKSYFQDDRVVSKGLPAPK